MNRRMKPNSDKRETGYHAREHDEDPTCHRTHDGDTPCEPVDGEKAGVSEQAQTCHGCAGDREPDKCHPHIDKKTCRIAAATEAGVSELTIDELREVAQALSGALQIATRENDLLRRQVEALAKEFSEHGVCADCAANASALCRSTGAGITCGDSIKQWSLERAKKGGGGEHGKSVCKRN
jgi:hypothetical protein